MKTHTFTESGMTFGPYQEGQCFRIEKSSIYKRIQKGVKMAEFLLLRHLQDKPPVVWVVEAKSSTPHLETRPNFDDFLKKVHEQMINAFSLVVASCLNRHQEAEKNSRNRTGCWIFPKQISGLY